jgi:hypothetical protein
VIKPTTPTGSRVTFDVDSRSDRGQLVSGEAQHFAGEKLEDLSGAHHFADAFGQRLALLAREQPPELVLAGEDFIACAIENVRALLIEPFAQPANAFFAEAIAVRVCAASACAYSPMTSLTSDGLRLGEVVAPATHSPAM